MRIPLEAAEEGTDQTAVGLFRVPDVATANQMLRISARLKPDETNFFDLAAEFLGLCLEGVENVFSGETKMPIQCVTDNGRKVLSKETTDQLLPVMIRLWNAAQKLLKLDKVDRKNC